MIKRKTTMKRRVGVKKKTSSQSSLEAELHRVYSKMDANVDKICTGCGCHTNLSHSHIISRSDHELMTDPRNITYHCLPMHDNDGCSYLWEQVGLRAQLSDYIDNMIYIKEVRPQQFIKMIIDDYDYFQNNAKISCLQVNFCYICKELKNI